MNAHDHFCHLCYGHKTNGRASGWWRCVVKPCLQPEKVLCRKHAAAVAAGEARRGLPIIAGGYRRGRVLSACLLTLVLASPAFAQTRTLSGPVRVGAADEANTYPSGEGTFSVTGVELGVFAVGNLAAPLSALPVQPVPPATQKIDTTVYFGLDVPSTLIPEDGKSYRIGLRYHTTYTPRAIPTTPTRTPPDPTLTCAGVPWRVAGNVFERAGQATQGRGSQLICTSNTVYGLGSDGAWWRFTSPGGSQEWVSTFSGTEPATLITFPPQPKVSEWAFASESLVLAKGTFTLTTVGPGLPIFSGAPPSPLYGRVIGGGL